MTSDLDRALCRSLVLQALSIGFRAPDGRTIARVASNDAIADLEEAAALLDAGSGGALADHVRRLAGRPGAGDLAALAAAHERLFGHTARGAVPPYETEYGDDGLFRQPQEIADVAGFFAAFGLVLDPRRHERADHVACELEFLAFLALKEAHAIEVADAEMLDATRRAARLFLRDHLARFGAAFARRVADADAGGFHGGLAALLLELLRSECTRAGVAAGPETLRLREPVEDGAPMMCGAPEGCGVPGPCGPPEERGLPGPNGGPGGGAGPERGAAWERRAGPAPDPAGP